MAKKLGAISIDIKSGDLEITKTVTDRFDQVNYVGLTTCKASVVSVHTGKLWQPSTWLRFEKAILIKPDNLSSLAIVSQDIDITQS